MHILSHIIDKQSVTMVTHYSHITHHGTHDTTWPTGVSQYTYQVAVDRATFVTQHSFGWRLEQASGITYQR